MTKLAVELARDQQSMLRGVAGRGKDRIGDYADRHDHYRHKFGIYLHIQTCRVAPCSLPVLPVILCPTSINRDLSTLMP